MKQLRSKVFSAIQVRIPDTCEIYTDCLTSVAMEVFEEHVTGLIGYLTAAVPELHQMHPDALNEKRKEYEAQP